MYQVSDMKECEAHPRHSGESRNPVVVDNPEVLDSGSSPEWRPLYGQFSDVTWL